MLYNIFVFVPTFAFEKNLLPKKEILQRSFGAHVKKMRTQQGLSQVEVSSNMNKDQQSLQRIESGKVSPSLFYLFQLAEALNISISSLVDFDVLPSDKKK